VYLALELVDTHPVREVTLGGEARRQQQVSCLCVSPVLGVYNPLRRRLVEMSPDHACLECNILLDIQLLVDVFEVLAKLREARISLGPRPVLSAVSQSTSRRGMNSALTFQTSGIEYSYIGTCVSTRAPG
jgi:hypothetical protein